MNSLELLPQVHEQVDFLYLDSYDVDFLDPKPSAEHHLKEFNLIKHLLKPGSVVLIDDTPYSPEWLDGGIRNPIYEKLKKQFDPNMSGKGSLVNIELEKMGAKKIMHQYQTLWVI
jgi:predicted O-methyltransferase YrrM